jgi:hypothetical protein
MICHRAQPVQHERYANHHAIEWRAGRHDDDADMGATIALIGVRQSAEVPFIEADQYQIMLRSECKLICVVNGTVGSVLFEGRGGSEASLPQARHELVVNAFVEIGSRCRHQSAE